MIKPKWHALVLAWRAMAEAAGFRAHELRAAASLTATVFAAYLIAVLLALTGPANPGPATFSDDPSELTSVKALDRYYQRAETSAEPAFPPALRVPSLFLDQFPGDYGEIADIEEYKIRFVQIVLPLVLVENRRLRHQRASLVGILARARSGVALRPSQHVFLRDLGVFYRTGGSEPEALISRIDAVPVSLALAQAAEESFWGRSRFAREGNALFGQWTYDASIGLVPLERPEDADYLVRKFTGLRASVRAYMANLNTHPAYADFRRHRAEIRENGQALDGYGMARTLRDYSQRGEAYIESLQSIIRVNRFAAYDLARLRP